MQWADRIGAAETELKKQRLRTMLEVRALLSPEQRQKLVKIFEERRRRTREWDADRRSPGRPTRAGVREEVTMKKLAIRVLRSGRRCW